LAPGVKNSKTARIKTTSKASHTADDFDDSNFSTHMCLEGGNTQVGDQSKVDIHHPKSFRPSQALDKHHANEP